MIMDKMKDCPCCGKEIISSAKKCKHCGEWLEKKCPQCGEWIKADAKKCRYCGSWLNKFSKERYERENGIETTSSSPKTKENLEDTLEDYEDKQDAGCLMNIECGLIIGFLGFCQDWPWWGLLIAWTIGYILLQIYLLRILYCIGISIIWAFVGLASAPILVDDTEWDTISRIATDNYADYWWMAALFGIASLIFHWPAMKSRFSF